MMPDLSIDENKRYRKEEALGTFKEDLEKYKDESWTKKDVIEGLKKISEVTAIGGLGLMAACGVTAITGGLGLPASGPLAMYSMAAVFRAYEEASPREKFCMRVAGKYLTGRFLF